MMFFEPLKMALQSLWGHKLRSTLTILGVVIGVASVLAVTSLGAAFEESITSQFDSVDDRSIFVTAGPDSGVANGPPDAGQFGLVFTEVDRDALAAIPGVERVIASGEAAVTNLKFQARDLQYRSLTATTQDADEVRETANQPDKYLVGGPFTDGASEMVLGYAIAQQLSGVTGDTLPTIAQGDTVVVTLPDGSTLDATVAGVLAKDDTLFGGANGQVFVPVDPFYKDSRISPTSGENVRVYLGFTVVAASVAEVTDVRAAVDDYMTMRSDAFYLLDDVEGIGVLVATAGDIQSQIGTAFDQITVFIAGIAGVSLLVGGIMIGTIMLISVAERTKEIGMMKAIGALNRDVLMMFLLESAIIGLLGSIIGILLGVGAGAALIAALFGGDDVSFVMPWNWVGIAVAVGVGTGILAGLLPANRAVKIQPVEALSYE